MKIRFYFDPLEEPGREDSETDGDWFIQIGKEKDIDITGSLVWYISYLFPEFQKEIIVDVSKKYKPGYKKLFISGEFVKPDYVYVYDNKKRNFSMCWDKAKEFFNKDKILYWKFIGGK